MNGGIMLDTNVIIYSLGGNPSVTRQITDKEHFISEITEIELLGFHGLSAADEEIMSSYLSKVTIISLNASIKTIAIDLRREYKLKIIDAIIAASAIYFDLPFVTADKAFKKIIDLNVQLINP